MEASKPAISGARKILDPQSFRIRARYPAALFLILILSAKILAFQRPLEFAEAQYLCVLTLALDDTRPRYTRIPFSTPLGPIDSTIDCILQLNKGSSEIETPCDPHRHRSKDASPAHRMSRLRSRTSYHIKTDSITLTAGPNPPPTLLGPTDGTIDCILQLNKGSSEIETSCDPHRRRSEDASPAHRINWLRNRTSYHIKPD
ncbi:hypothetical protein BDY21DRAFT_360860 [Lineolata rhizophorae]|uniref:Uncharacterized protein n=1 Tax=Lineolata rhizophorae TaxID=578093 RepID=A0A6A6PA75_9PEZI|nr:hypothetical protein BDY21DRAFT_360860 [Lineolata rhizophorae]